MKRTTVVACLLLALGCALIGAAMYGGGVAAAPLLQTAATPTLAPGTGAVAGLTWTDVDTDGVVDPGEQPLAGMSITAENTDTGATASATSAADGQYRIVGLTPGVYRISATPPAGYELTTQAGYTVTVSAGGTLTFNFGARVPPTPTPTPTRPPLLDIEGAEQLACGGVYSGNTGTSQNNVSAYSCRPWWDESGNEAVYRLLLNASQPVTVTLLSASADLDLFLLRYAYPDSCLAAGDNYLSYQAESGAYFLSVDGYKGAQGDYVLRVDCPAEEPATPTPTYTPSPTPTNTPTGTPAPTLTPSPTRPLQRWYLPMILRSQSGAAPLPVTFVLQDGLNAYSGTTDTTLSSWEPTIPFGSDKNLRLTYARNLQFKAAKEPVLRFDLSLLPTNANVENATLRLYKDAATLYDVRASVAGLLRRWDEGSATWEVAETGQPWLAPGASALGEDRTTWASEAQLVLQGSGWYEFDVTALVRGWSATPASNYGMVVLASPGESEASVEVKFVSREGPADYRPQLVISFTLP